MRLLVKGGRVVDPAGGRDEIADVLIENGKIVSVGQEINSGDAEIFDASNKIVAPGFIDMHVHLREPGFEDKETIMTGSRAAAAGGFTSVACMPNTRPVIDNKVGALFIKATAAEKAAVNVFPIGSLTKGLEGLEISEIGELHEAGVTALSDDGRCVANSSVMRRAMEYSKMYQMTVISHCEDSGLADDGCMNEGYVSTVLGLKGIPNAAEEIMVARDIMLAKLTGAKLHIAHVSTRGSVDLVRRAKAEGLDVSCEATPHHFTLTDDAVKSFDTSTKVNPPLRSKDDVNAILEGFKDGTIDVIATDHAPHTVEEKEVEYAYAPFGLIGLETAVPLAVSKLLKTGVLDIAGLIEKMSTNPARILGLKNKGELRPGFDGDLTILDIESVVKIDVANFKSKARNCPFDGWLLTGEPWATIVGGKIVMCCGEIRS